MPNCPHCGGGLVICPDCKKPTRPQDTVRDRDGSVVCMGCGVGRLRARRYDRVPDIPGMPNRRGS